MQDPTATQPVPSSGEQAILEAAEILFAQKGFDAVSMSAIASLANTSKPNIYHHFKNKNDLYVAVMKTAVRRTAALLDALEDAPGPFSQRIADFAAGQLHNVMTPERSTKLVLRETLTENSRTGQEIARLFVGDVVSRLVEMIHQGQLEKEFRGDIDPTLAAYMIFSANMFFFQSGPVMSQFPEIGLSSDARTFSRDVMDLLINGMLNKGDK